MLALNLKPFLNKRLKKGKCLFSCIPKDHLLQFAAGNLAITQIIENYFSFLFFLMKHSFLAMKNLFEQTVCPD